MEKLSKNIIFFLHLNNNTIEKDATPIYNNPISKKKEFPSLLCKMKNKYYKTVYTMYLLNIPITNEDKTIPLILQLKNNMNYPFDINIKNNCFEKEHSLYYFHFEKIIFEERIKNSFFENFLSLQNKNLSPPFSCDINIFEQMQLILAYINNQKRKEQFELLNSLKIQLGFSKFTRFNELFLIYLKIIFEENYNIQLIQELLDNYKYINFSIKNSFNYSLFFDTIIKPIFLKSYTNRNFIIYNNFEYDLRNCLNEKYNKIFDKWCIKYYVFYDIDFIMNEKNIITRVSTKKQKYKFYEIFHEVLLELNKLNYNNFFHNNNLLSDTYLQNLINAKNNEINEIKQKGINKNIVDLNRLNGLKIYELDDYTMPIYFLGQLNNGCAIMSVDDKELYIYDKVLEIKIKYQFSRNTTSLYQLQDRNIIIVYSYNQKICIIDTKNIYKKMEQIYSFNNINDININDNENNKEEYILKIIEVQNKNLVKLSKNVITFYYNNIISNENIYLYNYQKYYEIVQKKGINNFAILEFSNNYINVCSGKFSSLQNKISFSNDCYLSFINIKKNNENNSYDIDYSFNKVNGLIVYYSVFEDNNILIKLTKDILGIGGKYIYLYSLKNKEIFQSIEIPSISNKYYYSMVSSFLIEKNNILYTVIKYFTKKDQLKNFIIKYYIYVFNDDSYLNKENELSFLSEAKPNSQQPFLEAQEIQF